MALLQEAGINPKGMMSFFDKLSQEQEEASPFRYFSTHPPITERRHHLENLASAHSIPYQEFSFEQDWEIILDLWEGQPAESKK